MNSLQLQGIFGNYALFEERKKSKNYQKIKTLINQEQDHQCYFCNVKKDQPFDLINLDHNYENNIKNNLVAACDLCSACCLMDQFDIQENYDSLLI